MTEILTTYAKYGIFLNRRVMNWQIDVKSSKLCKFEISICELPSKFRYILVFKMILSAKIKI